MNIAIVSFSPGSDSRHIDYHVHTAKAFVEERSGGRFKVDIVEVALTDRARSAAGLLSGGRYEVVLFHIAHWSVDYFREVAAALLDPKVLVGVWGHDSFSHPGDYLKGTVRFIIQDEPELPLYEVAALTAEGRSPAEASDIIFRDDQQKTYRYSERRVLSPLDLIPSPYLTGLIEVDGGTSVYWEVARGCLFRCDFCVEFSHLSPVRYHGFRYLEEELRLFRDRGVAHLIVGAPIFNLNGQHFRKILAMIGEFLPDARIEMQVRPDLLSREEMDLLAGMNVLLRFGIPTFKPKALENLVTSLNIEKAVQNIRYINNYPDLPFTIDLMGGLPRTTYQDLLADLEKTFSLAPVRIDLYRLSLYPGTRIYNRVREFELSMAHAYPWHVTATPQFVKRDIARIDELAEGVELLYNRGRMVSVFTMLASGLGLSGTEVVERWGKYLRKSGATVTPESDFDDLFGHLRAFFASLYDKMQKKKLWPLAEDLLMHNRLYTMSLMTPDEDRITFPYQIEAMTTDTVVGVNRSVFVHRFNYNIEDVVDAGYIDLKRFASEEDKEHLYGLIYRLEGGVFARSVSDGEGALLAHLMERGETTVGKLRRRFSKLDVEGIVSNWCEEGALYLAS